MVSVLFVLLANEVAVEVSDASSDEVFDVSLALLTDEFVAEVLDVSSDETSEVPVVFLFKVGEVSDPAVALVVIAVLEASLFFWTKVEVVELIGGSSFVAALAVDGNNNNDAPLKATAIAKSLYLILLNVVELFFFIKQAFFLYQLFVKFRIYCSTSYPSSLKSLLKIKSVSKYRFLESKKQ